MIPIIDIEKVAKSPYTEWRTVMKKPLVYQPVEEFKDRRGRLNYTPFTYTIHQNESETRWHTYTSDGVLETTGTSKKGDYVFVGVSGEVYVLSAEKVRKLYDLQRDGSLRVKVVGSQREVAEYRLLSQVQFMAPWGEMTTIRYGDYLVKEPMGEGYYRIGRKEFMETYDV